MSVDYLMLFFEKIILFIGVITVLTLPAYLLFFRNQSISFNNLFFSLFAGIFAVSILPALIYTSLVSIHIVFILLIIFGFIEKMLFNPDSSVDYSTSAKSPLKIVLISCLIGVLFIFSWSFFQHTKAGDFSYNIPAVNHLQANDYIINSFRSHFMKISGSENYFHAINLIDENYQGVKPYHYYEMWINVGITDVIGGLNAVNFSLITFPALHFLTFLGILALWETKTKISLLITALSLCFMLFAGLYVFFYDHLGVTSTNLPVLSYRLKMAVYYPFIFAFLLQFVKGNRVIAILFLLGLAIATIVTAPGIIGGLLIFSIVAGFLGIMHKKLALRSFTYVMLMAVSIICFYALSNNSGPNIRETGSLNDLIVGFFNESNLVSLLQEKGLYAIKELWRFLLLFGPFFSLIIKLRSRLKLEPYLKQMLLLTAIVLLVALCAYLFFAPHTDALQLSYNLFISIINSVVIFLCVNIIATFFSKKPTNKHERISLTVLVILISISAILQTKPFISNVFLRQSFYSDEYLLEVKDYFNDKSGVMIGGTINGEKDFHSSFSYQVAAYSGGYHLAFMENGVIPISLSDMGVTPNTPEEERDLSNGVFHRYVANQKISGDLNSIEESQLSFIKKNHIKYLIVSKNGTLPETLNKEVKRVIRDKKSMESFVILH